MGEFTWFVIGFVGFKLLWISVDFLWIFRGFFVDLLWMQAGSCFFLFRLGIYDPSSMLLGFLGFFLGFSWIFRGFASIFVDLLSIFRRFLSILVTVFFDPN
jgi:hypothetical protein